MESSVLDPVIVEAAVVAAFDQLARRPAAMPVAELRAALTDLDGQCARLTEAVRLGAGALPTLVRELGARIGA